MIFALSRYYCIMGNEKIELSVSSEGPVQRQQSTACALGTTNPTWRQSLIFPSPPCRRDWPSTSVHVTVWDRDRFLPDRLIGEVTIGLGGKKTFMSTMLSSHLHSYAMNKQEIYIYPRWQLECTTKHNLFHLPLA